IEGKSDAIRTLKGRLAESQALEAALQRQRDDCVAVERELQNGIRNGETLLKNAKSDIARFEAEGTLDQHRRVFPDLDKELGEPPLSTNDFFERKDRLRTRQAEQVIALQDSIKPVQERLLEVMGKFLRVSAHETNELRATVEYLP